MRTKNIGHHTDSKIWEYKNLLPSFIFDECMSSAAAFSWLKQTLFWRPGCHHHHHLEQQQQSWESWAVESVCTVLRGSASPTSHSSDCSNAPLTMTSPLATPSVSPTKPETGSQKNSPKESLCLQWFLSLKLCLHVVIQLEMSSSVMSLSIAEQEYHNASQSLCFKKKKGVIFIQRGSVSHHIISFFSILIAFQA